MISVRLDTYIILYEYICMYVYRHRTELIEFYLCMFNNLAKIIILHHNVYVKDKVSF